MPRHEENVAGGGKRRENLLHRRRKPPLDEHWREPRRLRSRLQRHGNQRHGSGTTDQRYKAPRNHRTTAQRHNGTKTQRHTGTKTHRHNGPTAQRHKLQRHKKRAAGEQSARQRPVVPLLSVRRPFQRRNRSASALPSRQPASGLRRACREPIRASRGRSRRGSRGCPGSSAARLRSRSP